MVGITARSEETIGFTRASLQRWDSAVEQGVLNSAMLTAVTHTSWQLSSTKNGPVCMATYTIRLLTVMNDGQLLGHMVKTEISHDASYLSIQMTAENVPWGA